MTRNKKKYTHAPASRGRLLAAAFAAAAAMALGAPATAQQAAPKAEPKAAPKPAPKAAPKAEQKGGPAQPHEAQATPQLTFSPWTKVCQKPPEASASPKQICFTGRDGRADTGTPMIAAVLIEPEGEPRKLLRVTLPLGMALQPGTRVVIDQGQPITGRYLVCLPNGCMADYEASGELIDKLKTGHDLHVQGVSAAGQPLTLTVPLADFAKAHDGPPSDPATLPR
ncbi:MAG TPA: invasion associated locus B family protein [Xanthobacteraceae bacterium]|jgi:invasion protein IalB